MVLRTRSVRWWSMMLALMFALFFGLSFGTSVYLVNQSQHRWCELLSTIQPPHDQPSESNQPFFVRLKGLESQFGCRK